ncbi:SURF1 family protein [Sinomonas humi]|uniref:SURF1 family protein n=1 Tax=Sinomonas humi TaxID=1338436 RepID=UPI0009DD3BFF|nr:SURF1 family protein [Sinomonas humi]
MLRTALKPRWILALIGALAVSSVFVLLSQWQFSRSTSDAPPVVTTTETPQPLTKTLQPATDFPAAAADQMITATGHYDASKQVLVPNRLLNGVSGWWVVTAFVVDGAPAVDGDHTVVIPVARGWLAEASQVEAPPSGEVQLTGRLEPSEAPQANKNPAPGQASMVAVPELINMWDVQSYTGFVGATHEVTAAGDQSASAVPGLLKPVNIPPQPKLTPVNWLNIFYAVEWVVFAGFAIFLWWRLVRDEYERELEARADDESASSEFPSSGQSSPDGEHLPSDTGGKP